MTPSPSSRVGAGRRIPWRYRLSVASRVVAALAGGYLLTSLTAALLALALPLPREEAVRTAALVSFLIYPAAVLWVFIASSARRAWLGLLVPALVMSLAVWWLRRGLG
jgi:hypothetical protein